MAKFSSKTTEKKIISLFFKKPFHVKALDTDLKLFSVNAHRNLVKLIRKYVKDFKDVPTKETLIDFSNSQIEDETDLKNIPEAIEILDTLPEVKTEEANYYFEKAQNYKTGREIYDLQNKVTNAFEKHEVDFRQLRQDLFEKLLFMGEDKKKVKRGYIYETVQARWKNYNKLARGEKEDLIPYGIKALDETLGGMKRTFLTLIYGESSVGKTRFATNIAYNAACAGYNVMYVSLEMAFDLIATVWDARMAGIDSHKILFGKLESDDKKAFANALKKQAMEKLNIWISDIPMGATMAHLFEETEIYRMATGKNLDFVVIDYSNLINPVGKDYQNTSGRFEQLFKEYHEYVRYYQLAGMTMMQESREATKADIKKETGKGKKDAYNLEGLHNIAQSNFVGQACETAIRLKRNEKDELNNRMWAVIDKSRYGSRRKKIPLFAAMDINLIGDRELYAPHKVIKED